MTYRFECRCGKKLEAKDEELGEEVRCPQCGARILLPFTTEGKHGYVGREKLARPALILSLLPFPFIIYTAIEMAALGPAIVLAPFAIVLYNLLGIILWLGQCVTVVLGAISLRRIRRAAKSGGHLEGEREATFAVVLGSVWLALWARFMLYYFLGV